MYASIVRTCVPLVVGVLLVQAAKLGVTLPEGAVTEIVTVILAAVYYAIGRAVEQYRPALGRILLSAGLTAKAPLYVRESLGTGHDAAERRAP